MNNMFNGIMGRIEPGLCRMTPNGQIGIKTKNGYKTYDVKTGQFTNCANFVFDIGEEYFFVMPTNKVKTGDIVIISGTPRCVIETKDNEIIVLNYENSTKECIVPESNIFYGKSYLYGKIVSPMKNFMKGNNMFKYMMLSEMIKGMNNGTHGMSNNMMSNPMALMMISGMFGGKEDIFDGMFDFDECDSDDESEDNE